jgi:hypothetical protein
MMTPIWAIFLLVCVAGALAMILRILLGGRGAPWLEALLGAFIPFVTGALFGFVTLSWVIPVPITWLVASAVGALLVIQYTRQGRLAHLGLLAIGFGLTWPALLGAAIWNDLTDPAVSGSPETFPFFGTGLAVLSAGLVIVALALATRRGMTGSGGHV